MIKKPGGLQIKGSSIRDGRSCSLQTALYHPILEAAEPDDSEYGDATDCRVALYTSVVTEAAGHIGELGYPGHKWELGYPGHRELGYPGHIGELGYSGHRRTRMSRTHRRTRIFRTHRGTRISMILRMETPLIVERLFMDLLWNQ